MIFVLWKAILRKTFYLHITLHIILQHSVTHGASDAAFAGAQPATEIDDL